jgi:hypothetical protein
MPMKPGLAIRPLCIVTFGVAHVVVGCHRDIHAPASRRIDMPADDFERRQHHKDATPQPLTPVAPHVTEDVVLVGVSRPPYPIGVVLVDRRNIPLRSYVLKVGDSTNEIKVLHIDEAGRRVRVSVDGVVRWIGAPGPTANN